MLLTPSTYIAKKVHTFATAGNQTCGQRFQVNRHLQLHHDGFCDLVNVSFFFTHITKYCIKPEAYHIYFLSIFCSLLDNNLFSLHLISSPSKFVVKEKEKNSSSFLLALAPPLCPSTLYAMYQMHYSFITSPNYMHESFAFMH